MYKPRQHVLLLLPSSENRLLVQWQGPYKVEQRKGEMDYGVQIPHKGRHLFHVNLLKTWKPREDVVHYGAKPDWKEEGDYHSEQLVKQWEEGEHIPEWQTQKYSK